MLLKTEKRGYHLTLEQDLLGDYVLTRYWYGLHNNLHGGKVQIFNDADLANKQYQLIARAKSHKGYCPAK